MSSKEEEEDGLVLMATNLEDGRRWVVCIHRLLQGF